jgi:hypothetical protein
MYKADTNVSEGQSASIFKELRQETRHVSEIECSMSVIQVFIQGVCLSDTQVLE